MSLLHLLAQTVAEREGRDRECGCDDKCHDDVLGANEWMTDHTGNVRVVVSWVSGYKRRNDDGSDDDRAGAEEADELHDDGGDSQTS